jgi:hypothetical protein
MHRPAAPISPWPRRILGLSGVASLALGLVLLPAAPSSLAVSQASSAAAGTGSAVTVHGPRLLNPATINPNTGTARLFSHRSTVTVSQTDNLVNQMLHVSWTGVTPTTAGTLPYTAGTTIYPVMVAECRVARPRYMNQCYGAQQDGTQGGTLPAGPINAVYSTTTARGTGSADIQILTTVQNQWLRCGPAHPCSLVLVPDQGGNNLQPPYSCASHLYDQDTATASFAFGGSPPGAPLCSWKDRIVVPLYFAATPDSCPIRNANLKIIGSPMLQRAMQQWDAGLCAGDDPLTIQYSSALAEPEAVQAVQGGLGDIALTTRPAISAVSGTKHYTYAPVAVTAVSVAYWADNDVTGEPYTDLKLDPRLLTKLLTTSYNLSAVSCVPSRTSGCDAGVDGNPSDIFTDPEFRKLNPHIRNVFLGNATSPADVPIVQSGHSDMTYEVTRWIAANKEATAFLEDTPDAWGMRIDSYFSDLKYPTDAFLPQDPSPQMAHAFSPVFPLGLAVSDMVENWPPGSQDTLSGGTGLPGNYSRLSQELPGQRALFAVLDEADAAAFLMPTAAILNHAGRYVKPTAKSMSAALDSMVTSSNKITQQVSVTSKNPDEYPLTMVVYAMVPTSGVSATKAAAIARWLRFVAGPGQDRGTAPGQLPVGYLPLPDKLRAQTLTAATAVQDQAGASPSPSVRPSVSPSPAKSLSTSPAPAFPTVSPKIATVAVRDPATAGILRYALPVILLVGGLAALGGASSALAGSSTAVAARLRRVHQASRQWRRKP